MQPKSTKKPQETAPRNLKIIIIEVEIEEHISSLFPRLYWLKFRDAYSHNSSIMGMTASCRKKQRQKKKKGRREIWYDFILLDLVVSESPSLASQCRKKG